MALVPLDSGPKGFIGRSARRYGRKRFGIDTQPLQAGLHHNGVLAAFGALEMTAAKGWKKLDPTLQWLAEFRTGMLIGCSWCIDYGYYLGMHHGLDPLKVRSVAQWRDSTLFNARERAVLEYAETATVTPVTVSEELAAELCRHFSEAELVELAAWVALENFRSRFNAGLGLHSQGFSDQCEVPMGKSGDGAIAVA